MERLLVAQTKMAAVFGARSIGIKAQTLSRQSARLLPIIHTRLMSNKRPESGKTAKDAVKEDPNSYNVPEYYSHNKDSYADLEVEMVQSGCRQSQPDPRVPYYHHYPWEKSA